MVSRLKTKLKALVHRATVASKLQRLSWARKSFYLRRRARRRLGLRAKPFGVNLVAYIRAEMGLGEAARGMAEAMQAAGVPFGIVNFEEGNLSGHTNLTWSHRERDRPDYDVTVLCINPDNTDNLKARLSNGLLSSRYVIGNWYLELPELPDEWVKEFALVNEIWAGSAFIRDAVSSKSPVPVVRIPPVVQVKLDHVLPRSFFDLPEKRFLFLAVCDTMSVLERKNPLGTVRAFKKAFDRGDSRVGLVVKFNNSNLIPPELAR